MAITFLAGIVLLLTVVAIRYLITHKPSPQQEFFFDLLEKNLPKETEGSESGISNPGSTSLKAGINPGPPSS